MLPQLALLTTLLTSFATGAPTTTTLGQARVVNNCAAPAYVWSVGANVTGSFMLPAQGGSYGETFVKDPVTGGKALKVTKTPDGLYSGAPQTILAYSLDGSNVWYDLSDVFGDGYNGSKLAVASADTSCPSIVWAGGVSPAGSQVKVCESSKDVVLTLCA